MQTGSIFQSIVRAPRTLDVEFRSGLQLHQEEGHDLVILSHGESTPWPGAHLSAEADKNVITLTSGKIMEAVNDDARMSLAYEGSVLLNVEPNGEVQMAGTRVGDGHVLPGGGAAQVHDLEGGDLTLPFLLSPVSMGHRYGVPATNC